MALVGPLVAMVMMAMLIMVLHRGLRGSGTQPLTPTLTSPLENSSPLESTPRGADFTPPRPTLLTDCITDDYGLLATAATLRGIL